MNSPLLVASPVAARGSADTRQAPAAPTATAVPTATLAGTDPARPSAP